MQRPSTAPHKRRGPFDIAVKPSSTLFPSKDTGRSSSKRSPLAPPRPVRRSTEAKWAQSRGGRYLYDNLAMWFAFFFSFSFSFSFYSFLELKFSEFCLFYRTLSESIYLSSSFFLCIHMYIFISFSSLSLSLSFPISFSRYISIYLSPSLSSPILPHIYLYSSQCPVLPSSFLFHHHSPTVSPLYKFTQTFITLTRNNSEKSSGPSRKLSLPLIPKK